MPITTPADNIMNVEGEAFGINQMSPNARFEVNTDSIFTMSPISDIPAGGNIGTAPTTVDINTTFNVNQTTAGQSITLPAPTNTAAGRTAFINNVGTVSFTFYGATLAPNQMLVSQWDGDSWNIYNPTASAGCVITDTRANLLGMVGALNPACHYVMTDFAQGVFGAGTVRILLHATDASTFSNTVMFDGAFDNTAWYAQYDIQANVLIELKDNLGNIVYDRTGVNTPLFDWGNTQYTNVRLFNTPITKTNGQAVLAVSNVELYDSTLNITGSTGTFTNVYGNKATISATNRTLGVDGFEVRSSTLTAISGTGTLNITNSSLMNEATFTKTNNSTTTLQRSSIRNNSFVNISAVGAGVTTLSFCDINNQSTITHSGSGNLVAIRLLMENQCTITQSKSANSATLTGVIYRNASTSNFTGSAGVSISQFQINNTSSIDDSANGAGAGTITQGSLMNSSIITRSGTSTMIMNNSVFENQSSLSQSNGTLTITNFSASYNSSFNKTGAGITVLNQVNLKTTSSITDTHTASTTTLINCDFETNCAFTFASIATITFTTNKFIRYSTGFINAISGTFILVNNVFTNSLFSFSGGIGTVNNSSFESGGFLISGPGTQTFDGVRYLGGTINMPTANATSVVTIQGCSCVNTSIGSGSATIDGVLSYIRCSFENVFLSSSIPATYTQSTLDGGTRFEDCLFENIVAGSFALNPGSVKGIRFVRCNFRNNGKLILSAFVGTGLSYWNDITVENNSTLTFGAFTNTAQVSNTFPLYWQVSNFSNLGFSGSIGAPAAPKLVNITVDNESTLILSGNYNTVTSMGNILIDNNSTATFSGTYTSNLVNVIYLSNGSSFTHSGVMAATKNLQKIRAFDGSTIALSGTGSTINAVATNSSILTSSSTGTITNIVVNNASTFSSTTSGDLTNIEISNGSLFTPSGTVTGTELYLNNGTYSQSAGSFTDINLQNEASIGGATFIHNNVWGIGNFAQVLTANNTNTARNNFHNTLI